MVTSTLAHSPRVAHHLRVGSSTGYMTDERGDWLLLVERAAGVSTDAVELAALSEPELPDLIEFLDGEPALPFHYLSLHAPSKERGMPEGELIDLLESVSFRVQSIVVHPDTLEDVRAWRKLGGKLVIENMDRRKSDGRTTDELKAFFEELPEARLCFDVAHAWSVDPSMEEGKQLLDHYGSRLRHLHVSSLDEDQHHIPLTEEHETLFGPLLDRCRDVPWILEAPPRSA
jgi:hypothetical protein